MIITLDRRKAVGRKCRIRGTTKATNGAWALTSYSSAIHGPEGSSGAANDNQYRNSPRSRGRTTIVEFRVVSSWNSHGIGISIWYQLSLTCWVLSMFLIIFGTSRMGKLRGQVVLYVCYVCTSSVVDVLIADGLPWWSSAMLLDLGQIDANVQSVIRSKGPL